MTLDSDKWKDMHSFGKIICFDLDGVICKYEGWKGVNVFGEIIDGASKVMNTLKKEKWTILIFTSRLVTIELIEFLSLHSIPYDDINGRVDSLGGVHVQSYSSEDINRKITNYSVHSNDTSKVWGINPSYSSIKPIASIYADDKDWRQEGKNFTKETWYELLDFCRSERWK